MGRALLRLRAEPFYTGCEALFTTLDHPRRRRELIIASGASKARLAGEGMTWIVAGCANSETPGLVESIGSPCDTCHHATLGSSNPLNGWRCNSNVPSCFEVETSNVPMDKGLLKSPTVGPGKGHGQRSDGICKKRKSCNQEPSMDPTLRKFSARPWKAESDSNDSRSPATWTEAATELIHPASSPPAAGAPSTSNDARNDTSKVWPAITVLGASNHVRNASC